MASGSHHPTVAEKLDVRKYLLVLARRKWWGIIPFLVLGLVFTVICLAVPYKFLSACVVKPSKSEVAELLAGGGVRRTVASQEIVEEEMLRYEHVMAALAVQPTADVLREVELNSAGDSARRGRLEEELYRRIKRDTQIVSVAEGALINISYLGDTPDHARDILNRLVNYFVENALAKERSDSKSARDMALAELSKAKDELDTRENALAAFREQHPGVSDVGDPGKRELLRKATEELETLDRDLLSRQRKLERYNEQLENMPKQIVKSVKPKTNAETALYRQRLAELRSQLATALKTFTPLHPSIKNFQKEIEATEETLARAEETAGEDEIELETNKLREQLEERKLELEADLDYGRESRRTIQVRKQRLEEEATSLPTLQKEISRLLRERTGAGDRYDEALKKYKRIDADYTVRMEGLVSFTVISPARRPHQRDVRHIVKLALMGLFVSLAVGVGAIAGTEFLDQSLSDVDTARDVLRLPSLGIIPYIETETDRRSRRLRYVLVAATIIVFLAALALAVWLIPAASNAADNLWYLIKDLCKNLT